MRLRLRLRLRLRWLQKGLPGPSRIQRDEPVLRHLLLSACGRGDKRAGADTPRTHALARALRVRGAGSSW